MQQSKPISITPKPECKTCDGNGMMKADLVPAPFGRGMIQLPEEYCHCVIDQLPPEGPDVDVEDFEIFLKFPEPKPEPAEEWKPGKCGGAIVSNVRGHYDSDGSIEFYGGYLVAESIPSQRYIHLISRAPAMLRLLEKLYPLIEEESERREFVIQDPKFLAEFSDDEKEYYTEMRKALNEIRAEIDRAHGRVDSTRPQEIEVTAQWGEASPENVITVAEPEPEEWEEDELAPRPCPHGFAYTECNACMIASDHAYDSARERRS